MICTGLFTKNDNLDKKGTCFKRKNLMVPVKGITQFILDKKITFEFLPDKKETCFKQKLIPVPSQALLYFAYALHLDLFTIYLFILIILHVTTSVYCEKFRCYRILFSPNYRCVYNCHFQSTF